ncbi:hypothetical protein ASC89_22100 [Devosia sp. Root413D1]|uniref:Qat anti-phage system QueC-like protein QatC n=1 Tax=Devosia sp. Root413D1 TaxID=1736531 RepID=UPI0006F231D1|nr:Qat anti-phage system QueC-like protein QatC [Devosia sp. Root413D1]KQW75632.1 hypothetical protein ASC89_22100 [Devosia sp. Root413D1]
MRHHSIVVALGASGRLNKNELHDQSSQLTELQLLDSKGRLDGGLGMILHELGDRHVVPSEIGVDLLLLAAGVTAADTRISRSSEAQDSWTREVDLYVPVSDPGLWSKQKLHVERMLRFLSGDRWRVYFRDRPAVAKILAKTPPELMKPDFDCVSLFSGGMDSFVGAIDLLASGKKPLFISHYWDISTSSQNICATRIGAVYGDLGPRHVRARLGFANGIVDGVDQETTTRARSFLFIALAALAASGLDDVGLIVPENGLIALNVPLDPLRLGAWSTRTTHPFYLARWQELLGELGIKATVANPYRFKTKGQMLKECANQKLVRDFAYETISCSSIAKARWRGRAPGHCGHCTPCLIRRAAMLEAFGGDQTTYTLADLRAQPLNARARQNEHIRSFQLMGARLHTEGDIEKLLVHKPGPLTDYSSAEQADYATVFRDGIKEVGRLLVGVVVRPG